MKTRPSSPLQSSSFYRADKLYCAVQQRQGTKSNTHSITYRHCILFSPTGRRIHKAKTQNTNSTIQNERYCILEEFSTRQHA